MQHWHLPTLNASTEKAHPREPGADAERVPSAEARPQVLFSHRECRGVMLHLAAGAELGDHGVRERAIVQVVGGRVTFESSGATTDCPAGTLIVLEPGERHAVRGVDDARLLLLLTRWDDGVHAHEPDAVPRNATAPADEG